MATGQLIRACPTPKATAPADAAGDVAGVDVNGRPERWILARPAHPATLRRLAGAVGGDVVVARLLHARGVNENLAGHLDPPLVRVAVPGVDEVVDRLLAARRKRILIHGDYDADGVAGTALLFRALTELGFRVEWFVPHRVRDGYGINGARVDEFAERCDVMITVDCGVGAVDEVEALQARGVEVIITDHHLPGARIPHAPVLNPRLERWAALGLPHLTGAGVAFHLAWALAEREGAPPPLHLADLATLGTIGDVASLLGDNRALVREGLARLGASEWPGVIALLASARLAAPLSARQVAYVIAPRLNAVGRLGDAREAVELLVTASAHRAAELATFLEARNQERRALQQRVADAAREVLDPLAPALVAGDPGWHPGVLGIVAAGLLEEFDRPVALYGGEEELRGSVRSVAGVHALRMLEAASEALHGYGGHETAAGFHLREGRGAMLRARAEAFAAACVRPEPAVLADCVYPWWRDPAAVLASLERLAPFGAGNLEPGLLLADPDGTAWPTRDGKHLQVSAHGLKGIGFGLAGGAGGPGVVAVATLAENQWNGVVSVQARVRAIAPPGVEVELEGEAGPAHERVGAREGIRLAASRGWPVHASSEAACAMVTAAGARLWDGEDIPGELVVLTLPGDLDRLVTAGVRVVFALPPAALRELADRARESGLDDAERDRLGEFVTLYEVTSDESFGRAVNALFSPLLH